MNIVSDFNLIRHQIPVFQSLFVQYIKTWTNFVQRSKLKMPSFWVPVFVFKWPMGKHAIYIYLPTGHLPGPLHDFIIDHSFINSISKSLCLIYLHFPTQPNIWTEFLSTSFIHHHIHQGVDNLPVSPASSPPQKLNKEMRYRNTLVFVFKM